LTAFVLEQSEYVKNSASIFCILLSMAGVTSRAQTLCATAGEGAVLTITAPAGFKFTTVNFVPAMRPAA
jgi:hypothetical protein